MITDDFHNAVEVAESKEKLKALTRDEKKEYVALRSILNELTTFQVRFIEAYIKTASASEAATLAGSNSNRPEIVGYKLLQNPKIQMAISIAMKKRIEAVGLDSIEVIQKLREIYDAAMLDGKYDAAIKACEGLQKEIDKAMKFQGLQDKLSGPGKSALNNKPIHMEDGVEVNKELENVISLIKNAESR